MTEHDDGTGTSHEITPADGATSDVTEHDDGTGTSHEITPADGATSDVTEHDDGTGTSHEITPADGATSEAGASAPMIRCRSLVQIYRVGGGDVLALQGLDLDVARGEMLGIVGASGSGKSTLLSVIGGLLAPTAGHVVVDGVDLVGCSRRRRERYRRERIGFVWQHSAQNLLADLTAIENVVRPLAAAGRGDAGDRAHALLDSVGLSERVSHRPSALSGGEQARVALAVALATEPAVLLADEPTGELDRATTGEVFELMRDVAESTGVTQIVVSHDPDLVDHVDRVIGIRDGRTSTELRRADGDDVEEILVVDEVGRVQLPADVLDTMDLDRGVTARVVDGSIVLAPRDDGPVPETST